MPAWTWTAVFTMPAASAAPVPSPSRMPRSRSGCFAHALERQTDGQLGRHVPEQATIQGLWVERA